MFSSVVIDENQARKDLVEIGSRCYNRGYIVAGEGNMSIRISESEILATPSGLCKGYLSPDQIVKTDITGKKLSSSSTYSPSSELPMHLAVYRVRPDIRGIVHAHPPTATGFAVAGIPLEKCILPEIVLTIGTIPIAEYGTPSTEEIPDKIKDIIRGREALLLANHGALAVGSDIYKAYFIMETIEQYAKILFTARLLGKENILTDQQIRRMIETHPGTEKYSGSCLTFEGKSIVSELPAQHEPSCMKEEGQMKQAELVMKITKEVMNRLKSQHE